LLVLRTFFFHIPAVHSYVGPQTYPCYKYIRHTITAILHAHVRHANGVNNR